MRKYIVLTTLAALAASGSAMADGISYNLVEGGYVSNEIDEFGLDGSGFAINGSFAINDSMFGFASVIDANYDQGSDLDSTAVSVGLGFKWSLSDTLDLTSGVSYENQRLQFSGISLSNDDGVGIQVGLRSRVSESLELSAGVKYTDFGNGLDDYTLGAGGRYYFSPNFAAGIDFSDNDDGTAWSILLRYDFDGWR